MGSQKLCQTVFDPEGNQIEKNDQMSQIKSASIGPSNFLAYYAIGAI